MITFSFSGTSHGEGYSGKIQGLPKGFAIDVNYVNHQLALRKCGSGRSVRQDMEQDVVVFGGLTDGKVDGEVTFFVGNASHSVKPPITALRGSHVDVVACNTLGKDKVRFANETASARNSVCYVVLGAICKQILKAFGIATYSFTQSVGDLSCSTFATGRIDDDVNCPCPQTSLQIKQKIDQFRQIGNSLGGKAVVVATGVPCGWGGWMPYSKRIDGQIAGAMMSIPSVKGVSFGFDVDFATLDGVSASEALGVAEGKVVYQSNKSGGVVGGVTTGQPIVCTLSVKPVPTVVGAQGVDCNTLQPVPAHYDRADTCVVPNVGVIAENMLAYLLLDYALQEDVKP
ncbi:MAG: chorismate synthase [Clostridia bacterium]|nr:chorismate synthase [Clostridia bacterium]